jgi:hypothetical protein
LIRHQHKAKNLFQKLVALPVRAIVCAQFHCFWPKDTSILLRKQVFSDKTLIIFPAKHDNIFFTFLFYPMVAKTKIHLKKVADLASRANFVCAILLLFAKI